jgi:hypothetical protein
VTIAKRPSVGRDGAAYGFDLGQARSEIFLQMGLDRKCCVICSSGKIGLILLIPPPCGAETSEARS